VRQPSPQDHTGGGTWLHRRGAGFVVGVLLLALAVPARACTGDCDGDGQVTVDEILIGVNIALNLRPLTDCPPFDAGNDGQVTIEEILAAVNAAQGTCATPTPTVTPSVAETGTPTPTPSVVATPIFPANYRETYTEVRDCRFSLEHGGVMIRVLANPIAAQPYVDLANPLPVGSVVVKEEYNGTSCDDANLIRWRAMGKQSPGFDPVDGDWHWQWVEADRSVTFDDKSTCIACHVRPECLARDHMCTVGNPPGEAPLNLVLNPLPVALLSVSGTSPSDVYAVGADPGDGFGPYVLHYEGDRWRRLNSGATGNLWWISVTPIDGDFYMVGEGGLILLYDPVAKMFTHETTPGTDTLFGIWGNARNNVWAVGGNPTDEQHGGVIWHFDGNTWNVEDTTTIQAGGIPTLFKVWGRNEFDVYAVGQNGMILHFDGTAWSQVPNTNTFGLFTVHGNADTIIATGGFFFGVILERSGDTFVERQPDASLQMNGVFVPPDGKAMAVGIQGSYARRLASGWQLQTPVVDAPLGFHAVWMDPEGGAWAVGGNLSDDLNNGILAYAGSRTISSEIVPLSACPPGAPIGTITVSYSNQVLPLLDQVGCLTASCHGGPFPSSNYDLRTYEGFFGPGVEAKSLKVCDIVPGEPDSSFLVEKLNPTPRVGVQMPNSRTPLTSDQIDLIRTWILEGASDDSPPTPSPTPTVTRPPTLTPTVTPTSNVINTPTQPPPTLSATCQQTGIICTIAGTGKEQFDGDGRPAILTSFYFPFEVAFDKQNNPLVLDWNNLRLRRINPDGTVQTILGTGSEAFPTDGSLGVDTPLHHASDVRFDPLGRLYIAGDHVPVVFRMGTDNRVFTIAGTTDYGNTGDGGPAIDATFSTPFGVLPMPDGSFYVADIDAHVVRYVTANGVIDRVAGNGTLGYSGDNGPGTAAQLAAPGRMAMDAAGNLYICETKNHVIRRLAPDGKISTFAGVGSRGYSGDNGPAKQANFDTPYDLAFAPNGDLYVSDSGNHAIRRIDANGMITTVVGDGTSGFMGDGDHAENAELNRPSGVSFDANGSMWIADTFNERVRRVWRFLDLHN
jgi:sugar lactone lactonase YvrE